MKVGLFPGQGIEGRQLLAALPDEHVRMREAYKLLGFDLRRAVERSVERVPTIVAQPAILTAGVIAFQSRVEEGARYDYLLGHSLGEFTALVAGRAISFPQGLRLVAARARAMRRAANRSEGGMAAVLGFSSERVHEFAARNALVVANDNSSRQVVVSGSEVGLAGIARDVARAGGRVVRLSVEGAFHSPAMAPALPDLDEALTHVAIRQPVVPVVSNVTARPYRAPGEIRRMLLHQLTGKVRFRESVEWLVTEGATDFEDLGPGRVVNGLIRANLKTPEVARA